MDKDLRQLTRMVDVALLDAYKDRLKQEIEKHFNFKVKTILKDYDPETETAGTIIVLYDSLEG